MKNILVVGPLVSQDILHSENCAASPATNKYIYEFINGIEVAGFDYYLISFSPQRPFPLGEFFATPRVSSKKIKEANYINLPFIANILKMISIFFASLGKINNSNVIIFYNWHFYYFPTYFLAKLFKIRVVVINADYGVPLYISSDIIELNPLKKINIAQKAIFFPGFVGQSYHSQTNELEFSVLYMGAYNESTAIHELVELWEKKGTKIKLYLAGKVDKKIKEICLGSKYIHITGFLTDQELHNLCLKCSIKLECRNKKYKTYKNVFPSKILHYAQYPGYIYSNYGDCDTIFGVNYYSEINVLLDEIENFDMRISKAYQANLAYEWFSIKNNDLAGFINDN